MYGKPDGREREKPEDEERSVVGSRGTGVGWEGVVDRVAVLLGTCLLSYEAYHYTGTDLPSSSIWRGS